MVLKGAKALVQAPLQIEHGKATIPAEATDAFLAAMKAGDRVIVMDTTARAIVRASLRGLNAALLKMDSDQGRVDTATALMQPGDKPASSIPQRAPQPVISAPPKSAKAPHILGEDMLAPLRAKDPCHSRDAAKTKAHFFRLDDHATLLMIESQCMSYNDESQLFVIDDAGHAEPARIALRRADDLLDDNWLPSIGWEESDRTLTAYGKGRGAGDCGVTQKSAWDGRGFRLIEQREMNVCRGSFNLIRTFRLEVAPRR